MAWRSIHARNVVQGGMRPTLDGVKGQDNPAGDVVQGNVRPELGGDEGHDKHVEVAGDLWTREQKAARYS